MGQVGPGSEAYCGAPMRPGHRSELTMVFAGGVAGTLARAGLLEAWAIDPAHWPWPTFIANIAGAALLAAFATRLVERPEPDVHRHALLGVGLCGALTTFSGVQLELLLMLDAGRIGLAAAYATASVIVGLAIVVGVTRAMRGREPEVAP
jgi:CrcB protein